MKILLLSPWKNVWVAYFKKYFEGKGHTFVHMNKLQPAVIPNYDVLISGWADHGVRWLAEHPKLCPKYLTWVRSYEYWHNDMSKIDWTNFDQVLFTNKYIMDNTPAPRKSMVGNAIDLERIPYKEKKPGKEVMLLADINFKKGIPLLLQIAMKLPEYNFNIFGTMDSRRDYEYLRFLDLPNVGYYGYIKNIAASFDKHNYIILSSPVEGNPNCIIEGMASGLKPIVHRFVGSEDQYPFYWDTIDEAVELLTEDNYKSKSYREWVEKNYDMWNVYQDLERMCV